MENTDVKTEAMTDIFLDNKNNIKIETEVISVVDIDEIHIKVECKEEVNDYRAVEGSQNEVFDNDVKYEEAVSSTSVYCGTCSTNCNDAQTLKEHLEANPECKQFDNGDQNVDMEQALEHHTYVNPVKSVDETDTCDICNKPFTQKSGLDCHKRIVIENSYSCAVCKQTFTRNNSLKVHYQLFHAEQYPCDLCNQICTDKNSLIVHKQWHRKKVPDFVSCDVCKKLFTDNYSLKIHKRTHTGERPYSCDICNKSYPSKGSLKNHKRTHTVEREYVCDICNKSFHFKCNLNKHKRTHTGKKH